MKTSNFLCSSLVNSILSLHLGKIFSPLPFTWALKSGEKKGHLREKRKIMCNHTLIEQLERFKTTHIRMTSQLVISAFESTIIEFCEAASWINSRLLDSSGTSEELFIQLETRVNALLPVAQKYNGTFKNKEVVVTEESLLRLENAAGALWNTIVVSRANTSSSSTSQDVLILCQLFSALLLSIYDSMNETKTNTLRSLKCFVAVMRVLVDRNLCDDSVLHFEKEFAYTKMWLDKQITSQAERKNEFDTSETHTFIGLTTQYHACNFQSCINQGDKRTALLYLNKINFKDPGIAQESSMIIETSRIIYNSSLKMFKNKKTPEGCNDIEEIIVLLEKAKEITSLPSLTLKTHVNYSFLRYSILILLVQCGMENPNQPNTVSIKDTIEELMSIYPKKVKPFHLGILYQNSSNNSESNESPASIMMQMSLTVDIETDYEDLICIFHDCSKKDLKACLTSVDYILQNRTKNIKNKNIIEKIILARFYITLQTELLNETEIISSLTEFYNLMEKTLSQTLSLKTSSSLITLLWNSGKKIEKSDAFSTCSKYYELALRDIISGSYADRAKIYRALVSAYISANDLPRAQEVLRTMTNEEISNPLTLFLSLRLHILEKDGKNVEQIVHQIYESTDEKSMEVFVLSLNLLKQNPSLLAKASSLLFKKLQELHNDMNILTGSKWSLSTVELIRFTIQSLLKANEQDSSQQIEEIESIQHLLEEPLKFLSSLKNQNILAVGETNQTASNNYISMNIDEIEWFSSTAYNLSCQILRFSHNLQTPLALSDISLQYISLIPFDDFMPPRSIHFRYWSIVCNVLNITIRYKISRTKDKTSLNLSISSLPMLCTEFEHVIEDIEKLRCDAEDSFLCDKISELLLYGIYTCFEMLLQVRDEKLIQILLKYREKFDGPSFDLHIANMVLDTEGVPSHLRKNILSNILEDNLESGTKYLNDLLYFLKCTNSDDKSCVSDRDYTIFEGYSVKLRNHLSLPNGNCDNENIREVIENIASICWNCGVNQLMQGNQLGLTNWCNIAFRFAKYGRTGFLKQMLGLWSTLTSSVNLTETEESLGTFDYDSY